MTDQELDNRLAQTAYASRAAALEGLQSRLLKQAGEAFSRRQDERAKVLREVAESLTEEIRTQRRLQAEAARGNDVEG